MYKGTKGLDQNHDWLSRVFTTKTLKNIYVMSTKIRYSDKKENYSPSTSITHIISATVGKTSTFENIAKW